MLLVQRVATCWEAARELPATWPLILIWRPRDSDLPSAGGRMVTAYSTAKSERGSNDSTMQRLTWPSAATTEAIVASGGGYANSGLRFGGLARGKLVFGSGLFFGVGEDVDSDD